MVVRGAIGLRPSEGEREPSGLTPADVPRVPELDLVLQYARSAQCVPSRPRRPRFPIREDGHYGHACRILGLVDAYGALTSHGRHVLDAEEPLLELVRRFEETKVAEAWRGWAGQPHRSPSPACRRG